MESYQEKFFIRCTDPETGEVYMDESLGDIAFEYKGFRFFIHGSRITDALCGMYICEAPADGIIYFELIEKAEEKIRDNFETYKKLAKCRIRANWRRSLRKDPTPTQPNPLNASGGRIRFYYRR